MSALADWLEAHALACPVRSTTGVICPGCGFQTSVIALLRGDLLSCLQAWPPLFPMLITFALLLFSLRSQASWRLTALKISYISTLVIAAAHFIFRLYLGDGAAAS